MARLRRNGFTLVEMLVVMAIIAVLMMLLTPVMRAVRQNMRAAQCLNNLKQLHHALSMYEKEYSALPPSHGQVTIMGLSPTWIQGNSGVASTGPKQGLLWKYYANEPSSILCPMDNVEGNGIFSYSMPIVTGMKSSQQCKDPAKTLMMLQESPRNSLGSLSVDGSFAEMDEPDVIHNNLTSTLYFDGHADMRDWREFNGYPGWPRTFSTYPQIPQAREIACPPWGYNLVGSILADY